MLTLRLPESPSWSAAPKRKIQGNVSPETVWEARKVCGICCKSSRSARSDSVDLLGPEYFGGGAEEQFISDFVSETGLFALCNCFFSYSYRLSDSTREEKKVCPVVVMHAC